MKRISLACAVLFLTSLALSAADQPAKAPLPSQTSLTCSLEKLTKTTPDPVFMTTLPAPCQGYTQCPGGGEVSCYSEGPGGCMISDSCWVICGDSFVHYCPGAESRPECIVY